MDGSQITYSFCGSPEYMAPEMLMQTGHSLTVDYYSLGAFLYELITGLPPYYDKVQEQMYEQIMHSPLNFPSTVSEEAKSLITDLMERDPSHRLGYNRGFEEIKDHEWFNGVDWNRYLMKEVRPPFPVNKHISNFDPQYSNESQNSSIGRQKRSEACYEPSKNYQNISGISIENSFNNEEEAFTTKQVQSCLSTYRYENIEGKNDDRQAKQNIKQEKGIILKIGKNALENNKADKPNNKVIITHNTTTKIKFNGDKVSSSQELKCLKIHGKIRMQGHVSDSKLHALEIDTKRNENIAKNVDAGHKNSPEDTITPTKQLHAEELNSYVRQQYSKNLKLMKTYGRGGLARCNLMAKILSERKKKGSSIATNVKLKTLVHSNPEVRNLSNEKQSCVTIMTPKSQKNNNKVQLTNFSAASKFHVLTNFKQQFLNLSNGKMDESSQSPKNGVVFSVKLKKSVSPSSSDNLHMSQIIETQEFTPRVKQISNVLHSSNQILETPLYIKKPNFPLQIKTCNI